jgi:hypothetical protein
VYSLTGPVRVCLWMGCRERTRCETRGTGDIYVELTFDTLTFRHDWICIMP